MMRVELLDVTGPDCTPCQGRGVTTAAAMKIEDQIEVQYACTPCTKEIVWEFTNKYLQASRPMTIRRADGFE